MMRPNALHRWVLAIALGGSAISAVLPATSASAAAGRLSLSISPVDSGATFGLRTDAPLYCPGDAEKGYRWGTFITSEANDPAAITYTLGLANGPTVTDVLTDGTSVAISNRDPGFGDGFVAPPTNIQLSAARYRALPAGEYRLGVACAKRGTDNVYRVVRYWDTPVIVERAVGAGPNGFRLRAAGSLVAGTASTVPPTTGTTPTSDSVDAAPVTTEVVPVDTTAIESGSVDTAEEAATLTNGVTADSAAPASEPAGNSRAGWWLLWLVVVALVARIGYLLVARIRARRGHA